MEKYLFLKVTGSLLLQNKRDYSTGREIVDWVAFIDALCMLNLNYIVKETDLKIILTDVPERFSLFEAITFLTIHGFAYPENIIGQTLNPDKINLQIDYDRNPEPFPIVIGNCIQHFINGFLRRPERFKGAEEFAHRNNSKYPDIKEPTPLMEEGIDFVYRVIGRCYRYKLLSNQQPNYIECHPEYGISKDVAKNLLLSF